MSVIVPVHNGAPTIGRALQSLIHHEDVEVIVVDDGSTDSTPAVLSNYLGRVTTVRQNRLGPSRARNYGASLGHGDYLAFLDSDDSWYPNFLERTIDALERAPGAVMAFSDIAPVDEMGRPATGFRCRLTAPPTMDDLLTQWWPILTSAALIRRNAFEQCGGFAAQFTMPGYEDPWLWLRLRELGEFAMVDEPLVSYQISPEFERMDRYRHGFTIFSKLVRARYGARGRRLITNCRRAYVSALGYGGLMAMRAGDRRGARRRFLLALAYRPTSVRTILRLARTFLPASVAASLTGRTRVADRAAFGGLIASDQPQTGPD